jgi:predicted metalloprotease with PDZ domain
MNAAGGMFTSALLSPGACSGIRPRYLFTLIFVPTASGVDVTTHKEMEHADGFCHPARDNWDDQNRKYAESYLGKVKATTEGTAPASPQVSATVPTPAYVAPSDAATVPNSSPTASSMSMPIPVLGVTVANHQGGAEIVNVMSGSVADLAYIHVGDVINEVDGKK